MNDTPRSCRILLVEDSDTDAELTERAFSRSDYPYSLIRRHDGISALEFLSGDGPLPHLILLDLHMPRMDGLSFLRRVKSDDSLKHVPVVVLTTSQQQNDILDSYGAHANAYIVKPIELQSFYRTIHNFETFWIATAKLPAGNN